MFGPPLCFVNYWLTVKFLGNHMSKSVPEVSPSPRNTEDPLRVFSQITSMCRLDISSRLRGNLFNKSLKLQRIIGSDLPSMDTHYTQHCRRTAQSISGQHHSAYLSICECRRSQDTTCDHRPERINTHNFHNSFFLDAVRKIAKDNETMFRPNPALW